MLYVSKSNKNGLINLWVDIVEMSISSFCIHFMSGYFKILCEEIERYFVICEVCKF